MSLTELIELGTRLRSFSSTQLNKKKIIKARNSSKSLVVYKNNFLCFGVIWAKLNYHMSYSTIVTVDKEGFARILQIPLKARILESISLRRCLSGKSGPSQRGLLIYNLIYSFWTPPPVFGVLQNFTLIKVNLIIRLGIWSGKGLMIKQTPVWIKFQNMSYIGRMLPMSNFQYMGSTAPSTFLEDIWELKCCHKCLSAHSILKAGGN